MDKLTCTVVEHYRLPTHCVGAVSAAVERGGGRKPVARSRRRDEECKDDGEQLVEETFPHLAQKRPAIDASPRCCYVLEIGRDCRH